MTDYLAADPTHTTEDALYKTYEYLRKHKIEKWNELDFSDMYDRYIASNGKADDQMAKDILEKIQDITNTDYGTEGEFLSYLAMESIIEDLLIEIDRLQERYDDLEKDVEENYKPIPIDLGLSDRDFY